MNKLVRGLLATLLAMQAAHATINTDRTFIAHRDYLSNAGMNWATKHHHQQKGNHRSLGATFTVTPFYEASTNDKGLAKLFGMGTTGKITVTDDGTPVVANTTPTSEHVHTGLPGSLVDHAPRTNFAEADKNPMFGNVLLKPKRRAWGAELSWDQSLSSVLKGLSLHVRMPIMEVSSSMRATVIGTASALESADGPSKTLDLYFAGKHIKDLATSPSTLQKGLSHSRIDDKWHSVTGIGDVDVRLNLEHYKYKNMTFSSGASLQIPTGNAPDGKWLFESVYGARRHIAAGLSTAMHADGFSKGNITFSFDVAADWKYFFAGTEVRALGIYDNTNKLVLPGSSYRNLVRNEHLGVQPSANVLNVDHTVTPGHQFEGLFGTSAAWKNWTFDLGYNVYWHEAEKVELKDGKWSDDRYAITAGSKDEAPTPDVFGYDADQAAKHLNRIGGMYREGGLDAATNPRYFVSVNGPIQNANHLTSGLRNQDVADPTEDTDGYQAVQYTVTTSKSHTAAQLTHSLLASVGYKCTGEYPMIIGLGGQYELQSSDRNSALEGFKVWAKIAVNF